MFESVMAAFAAPRVGLLTPINGRRPLQSTELTPAYRPPFSSGTLASMVPANSTCWTMIRAAAVGCAEDRENFVKAYAGPLRAFFGARWNVTPAVVEIDDAVQEVFLECFRSGGVLEHVDERRPGGFRAFLYGTARHVALRIEEKRMRDQRSRTPSGLDLARIETDETSVSDAFDRAWAQALLQEAARVMRERASSAGFDSGEQVRLLELRFGEGLPIREIARRTGAEPVHLHRLYQKSLKAFRAALEDVVARHHGGTPGEVKRECRRLQELLGRSQ
jgi:RNA polymerase sigma-70 factor (ECF subfamily)